MAKTLTEFPQTRRGRVEAYPWADWFNGEIHLLEKGIDFDVDPKNFRASAYIAAKRHGLKIRAALLEDAIAVQVLDSLD